MDNIARTQAAYESLRKLYQDAPEGSFARACLQLACRAVQVACKPEAWEQ